MLAFCEPFNERLARCTSAAILRDTEQAWDSRHPQLTAPYFAEYLPLLSSKGVARYEDRFALRRYFVPTQQPLDEAAYLASLYVWRKSLENRLYSASRARSAESARSSACSAATTSY